MRGVGPRPEGSPEVDRLPEGPNRPVVPRKRVAATVTLSDGSTLSGELYAAVGEPHGDHDRLLERLNDLDERYLPVACGGKHVLVNKSAITSVELTGPEGEHEGADAGADWSARIECHLDAGGILRGRVHAKVGGRFYRPLDHLNRNPFGFLRVVRDGHVVYLNHDRVLAVHDIPDA
jgi:hypothetical protein